MAAVSTGIEHGLDGLESHMHTTVCLDSRRVLAASD